MTNEVQLDGIGLTQMIRPVPPFDMGTAPTAGQALVWDATASKYKPSGVSSTAVPGAVADGVTDDTAALQAVIDTASATGRGLVLLPAGKTFLVGTLVPKSNVTIFGYGTTLLKQPASTSEIITNRNVAQAPFSNFHVYGVKFQGEGISAGNVAISTTERRGATAFYRATNVGVQDCTADGFAYQGFAFVDCVGVRVVNNTLSNVGYLALGNAIHLSFLNSGVVTTQQDAVVTGNTVTNCQTSACCIQDMVINASAVPFNTRVHHNNFQTSAFAPISVEIGRSSAGSTQDFTIRQVQIDHNICTQTAAVGSGTYGIQISDNNSGGTYGTDALEFSNIIVDHNTIISSDGGILCEASYVTIDHNNVQCAGAGIAAQGNAARIPTGVLVDRNIIRVTTKTAHGIFVSGIDSPVVTGNQIVHPTGSGGGAQDGIHVFSSANPQIDNNDVKNSPRNGVWTNECAGVTVRSNRIANTNQSAQSQGSGVLYGAPTTQGRRNRITLNEIWDDASTSTMVAAVYMTGSNARTEVSHNRAQASGSGWTGGGWLNGTTPLITAGNITDRANWPGSIATPSVGASPWTYTAADQSVIAVFWTGGTISSVVLGRGGSTITLDSGVRQVRLETGDTLTFTYTSAPTVSTLPGRF